MINALLTSVALLAGASIVNAAGSAVVVNQCSFPVGLVNVPASGGGQNQVGPETLNTGGTYSQQYTELTNGQGWSIKLYIGGSMATVLQYEYTFHNDGTIWYDLSAVNGDPFNGNWALSSDGSCDPRQAAYQYPTDDAYGEQSCPDSSTITVTLCGAGGGAPPTGSAPSGGSPAPAPQDPAPSVASPSVASPSVASPSPSPLVPSVASVPNPASPVPAASDAFGAPANKLGSPTTFATHVAATVTNVHTKIVTQWVTVVPSPMAKRSEQHLHRHAAHHDHF